MNSLDYGHNLKNLTVAAGILFAARLLAAQAPAARHASALAEGRQIFESQCSRCHGIDGSGGTGPNLRRPVLRLAPDDTALVHLIIDGVPARGMPGHWDFEYRETKLVATYVRSLGRTTGGPVTGDATHGQAIVAGRGGCTVCHMIGGQGGSLGPDLSDVGAARGPAYLRAALMHPGATPPSAGHMMSGFGEYARYVPVRIVTADGTELRGQRISEDSFTIQVRDARNHFYSFDKADLRTLELQFGQSLMPSYAALLSAADLDNVIAYLASLRGAGGLGGPS